MRVDAKAQGGVIRLGGWCPVRDAQGRALTVTNQKGAVTSYEYDGRGLLATRSDPNGAKTTFKSDAHGNLIEMRTARLASRRGLHLGLLRHISHGRGSA